MKDEPKFKVGDVVWVLEEFWGTGALSPRGPATIITNNHPSYEVEYKNEVNVKCAEYPTITFDLPVRFAKTAIDRIPSIGEAQFNQLFSTKQEAFEYAKDIDISFEIKFVNEHNKRVREFNDQ